MHDLIHTSPKSSLTISGIFVNFGFMGLNQVWLDSRLLNDCGYEEINDEEKKKL